MSVEDTKTDLNNEEFMCLVIRECNTRSWSGQYTREHQMVCRFCAGILFSSRELREAGMVLDEDGRPVPKEEGKNVEEA